MAKNNQIQKIYKYKWIKIAFNVFVYLFAAVGLFFVVGYAAVNLHITNVGGLVDLQNQEFERAAKQALEGYGKNSPTNLVQVSNAWQSSDEWSTTKAGILKDIPVIEQASNDAGVDPRLVVAMLVVEQLRLYTSEREVFKSIFAPLKILGSQTQFSWGVVGIKEDTAIAVESNLKDSTSQYYLGTAYEHLLDFKTTDVVNERFTRITDQRAHYYAYLYAALYLKEIMSAWKKAGFDISNRPEILSTLYNIGFAHSAPNASPQVGGAEININGGQYTFGSLAYAFYYSDQLVDVFPQKK